MRKWTAAYLVLSLAGTSAFAGDFLGLKNVTTDGSLEVLGVSADNSTDNNDPANDHRGNTLTRVRIGLNAEVTEGVNARAELVRNPSSAGAQTQYGDSTRPSSVDSLATGSVFQNAYIETADFLSLDKVRLGRQYVGRQGDPIVYFGPVNDDALGVSALDALSVWKKIGKVNLLGVTGKMFDDDSLPGTGGSVDTADGAGDTNLSFLIAGSDELLNLGGYKVPLEVGFYRRTIANTDTASDNNNLSILDLRAGLQCPEGNGSLILEYAMNSGRYDNAGEVDYKGSLLRVSAEMSNKEKTMGAHAQLVSASGDDQADDKDKSFRAINGDIRFGEILSNDNTFNFSNSLTGGSLSTGNEGPGLNILSIGGHYVIPAMDNKLTAHADYVIAKTSKDTGSGKKIGNELDLALSYAHNDSVSLKTGYAMLSPDEALTGTGPDDQITKFFAKLNVKWGGEN